jgi:hypothetical protein
MQHNYGNAPCIFLFVKAAACAETSAYIFLLQSLLHSHFPFDDFMIQKPREEQS